MKKMEGETSCFPPENLAKLIEKIMKKKSPRLRYSIGSFDQIFLMHLKKIIPFGFYEYKLT